MTIILNLLISLLIIIGYQFFNTYAMKQKHWWEKGKTSAAHDIFIKTVLPALILTAAISFTSYITTRHTAESYIGEIFANPEKLRDIKDKAEAKAKEEKLANLDREKLNQGISFGDAGAKAKVVEFYNYNCGHCRMSALTLEKILEKDDNVEVIYKPLASDILHKTAVAAFELDKEKGRKLHKLFFTESVRPDIPDRFRKGDITEDDIEELKKIIDKQLKEKITAIAKKAGFSDVDALFKKAESKEIEEKMTNTREIAELLEISGTPTFVIGDNVVSGRRSQEEMEKYIEEAR